MEFLNFSVKVTLSGGSYLLQDEYMSIGKCSGGSSATH